MKKLSNYCNILFVTGLIFVFQNSTLAQTGPGGVGTSANNIIWLDVHAMGFANGASIGTLTDFSGNSNNFTQSSSTFQPTNTSNALNGLPVATFDGVNDHLKSGSIAALESANITYFIVFQQQTLTRQMLINATYTSNPNGKWRTYSNLNSNKIIGAHYSPSISHVGFTDDGDASFLSHHITSSTNRIYQEGLLQQSKTAAYTTPTGHTDIFLGNSNFPSTNNHTLNGFIAEVVVFNSSLTTFQREMVQNYLAAKYNISTVNDRYAFEGTHNIELVGIGDNGSNSQSTAKGKGVMEFSAPAGMTANEYLLAAHTDVPLSTFNLIDLPAALVTSGHQRWERTWRADETGDVGTTTITFDLAGINDFGASTSYRLLVDTDGIFADATVLTGTYSSGSVSFNVDLNDSDYFTLAGIEDILEIHSIIDGDWGNPLTWDCLCIPGANDDVYIDPATSVTLNVDGNANYMEISTGGKLKINSDFNLSLLGEFEIIGTLEMTDGTISMDGSTAQYIELSGQTVDFNNIAINNTSGVDVDLFGGTYILNGKLSPNSGTTAIDGGATFIVNSTSATTGGRIGQIINPATITGTVAVRRFIPGGTADYRNMCSPIIGATFDHWDPDIFMSGPGFPDGCAFGPNGCFRSVKYHKNNVYVDVLNSTDPITNGTGYEIFLGDDLNTLSATTVTSTGTLNSGADIVRDMNTGWEILGNPYASPITYSTIQMTSQIGKYFYVYDTDAGSYQFYDNTTATPSASTAEIGPLGLVGIGQGIWVNASSAGSLTFKQTDKTDSDGTFIRSNQKMQDLQLVISEQGTTYHTVMSLQAHNEATDGMDSLMDIKHLSTGHEKAPGLAFDFGDDRIYRKNYFSSNGEDKTFNLYSKFLNQGYHIISARNLEAITDYKKVLLYDSETGEFFNLLESSEYVFFAEVGESDRFSLILSNTDIEESNAMANNLEFNDEISITQMGHVLNLNSFEFKENVTIILYNTLGQEEVRFTTNSLNEGDNLITVPSNVSGMNILSISVDGNRVSKKLVF